MELACVAPREYHEKTGRLVRKDKIYTNEEKKEKKRLKTVDSVELYEDYKDELPFVDNRNQVLILVFCCTCELNRLCSGYCYVPRAQP